MTKTQTDRTTNDYTLHVTGMDCAGCARTVETAVSHLPGVHSSTLNFTTEKLHVRGSAKREAIVARVRDVGYGVADGSEPPEKTGGSLKLLPYLWQRRDTRLALIGALLVLPGILFHELLPGMGIEHPLIDLLSVAAMVLAGGPIARSAWRSLRVNRDLNINVLMTIAAVGAVIIGAYTEAGLVMVLFALGEALEGYTGQRARQSIRSLMAVAPNEATVLRPCIDCQGHMGQDGYTGGPCPFCGMEEQRVPVEELVVGDRIIVKPGDRVPMDGRIVEGNSAVNQAPITGESRLIDKESGDNVFASSINGQGTLDIEVTRRAEDNTISRVIRMVEEAQEKQAPAQRFVDRFARVYTPAVVVLAALVALIPPLFFGQPFWAPDAPMQGWIYRGLALLVVACPCALVISTPVSIISAISNGARHGVLFKGGAHLEALSRIQAIAFDKTGTLTRGEPAVVAVRAATCTGEATCADCDDLLALAGAVEKRSEHPLATAVTTAAREKNVGDRYPAAEGVQALGGRGVAGTVNGRSVLIGSHRHFDDNRIPHAGHCAEINEASAQGYTPMLVQAGDDYRGYIAVADTVRESSREAVKRLQQMGFGRLVMLTGDEEKTAESVANEVGVIDVRANCLPEDKVTAVETLRRTHDTVAMVGDGINDAPALATATVGIAIGNTAQAMETADVTLMSDDLRSLPFAVRLSRATMSAIRANVALSIGIKLAFVVLVLLGWATMWMAVLADMGTSLLVTLNGMRLLRTPRPE